MSFKHPEMLYLLWLVPLMGALMANAIRRKLSILRSYAEEGLLRQINPAMSITRQSVRAGLFLVALASAILALSGVQYGHRWQKVKQKGVDIVVAVDVSKSMRARDVSPDRLERAKREVMDLVGMLKGDRIGLVAFAGTAFRQCPLTVDYGIIPMYLNMLDTNMMPVGGTDIGAAIKESIKAFDPEGEADKAVILITDGQETIDAGIREAAEEAKKAGVKLFVLGVGTDEGAPVPNPDGGGYIKDSSGNIVLSRLEESELESLASMTGGAYARSVAGDMDLDVLYSQEIRGALRTATVAENRQKIMIDRYQWFVGLAVLALLIEAALPSGRVAALIVLMAFALCGPTDAHAASVRSLAGDGVDKYESGDYEGAAGSLEKAALRAPDDPVIRYNLGNAQYKAGKYDEALDNYAGALEGMKEEQSPLKAQSFFNMGNASYRKGDLEGAIGYYEKSLEANPSDEDARRNIEFVKKMMQMQKQQQKDQQKNQKQDQQKEDKSGNGSGQDQQKEDKPGKGLDQQKSGEQKPGDKGQSEDQSAGQKTSGDKGQQKDAQQNAGQDDKSSEAAESKGQYNVESFGRNGVDESVLNRLSDKPAVPNYKKRFVERDW